MNTHTTESLQELKTKVEKRQKFLLWVLPLVSELLDKIGIETFRDEARFHTHVQQKLENFYGFVFYGDYGQTSMGGNRITIRYQKAKVLGMYFQTSDPKDFRVDVFEESAQWQSAIKDIKSNKRKYIAEFKQKNKKKIEQTTRKSEREQILLENEHAIHEAAKRLNIAVD